MSKAMAVVVLALVMSACSPLTPSPEDRASLVPLATQPPGAIALEVGMAEVQFVVDGDGCVVIEAFDQTPRYAIVWPHGYWAEPDPLRIHDETGAIVAREGVKYRVEGDLVGPDYPAETCGAEQIWYLSLVESSVPTE